MCATVAEKMMRRTITTRRSGTITATKPTSVGRHACPHSGKITPNTALFADYNKNLAGARDR